MEKIVETFLKLVKQSSPSRNERAIADDIIAHCHKLGLDVVEDDTARLIGGNCGNLIVHIEGSGVPILFDAHMDTVKPCDCIRPRIKDGAIYSDGSSVLGADDKAGIAAMLCMLETIVENKVPHPPITCVFTVCEEEGLKGVKNLAKDYYKHVRYAYVLDGEGTIGSIVSQTPYGCKGDLRIIGKEAHAGVCPEKGIHSLVIASKAINALTIGRIHEGLTCNIGTIQGGNASNVVMGNVQMSFEARGYKRDELVTLIEHTKTTFHSVCKHAGASFEETLTYGTPGYTIKEDDSIVQTFQEVCEQCNFPYHSEPCGGGSNANIYHMNGISALCIGTNMKDVHSLQESIGISDLIDLETLLLAIVDKMRRSS